MKTALITGVNGQDGSYLAEFLLNKGYRVIGTVRSKNPRWPVGFDPNQPNFDLLMLDMGYASMLRMFFRDFTYPVDEVYNLAAQSHVGMSFLDADQTHAVTGVGACLLMDAYFQRFPKGKFYQASTSEMLGNRNDGGLHPASPYAVAKVSAHYNAKRHTNTGKFCVSGILFNHESERRHESFVTQKICAGAVRAKRWTENMYDDAPFLSLGNLNSTRDWGYAPEYVEIMWKMIQEEFPHTTSVVGTGVAQSVRWFAEQAYAYVGLDWKDFVRSEPGLLRPTDVEYLCADATYANKLLGRPLTTVDQLIPIMMDHQLKIQGV